MTDFEFPEVTAGRLTSVNPNSEHHGETLVPTLSIRLSLDAPNSVLEAVAPGLKAWLFEASKQGGLPGVDEVSDATDLRFPEFGKVFRSDAEVTGYDLTLDYGISGDTRIRLSDCKLHKVVIERKRGGTCILTFTLTCTQGLMPDAVGHLGLHVGHKVHFRLTRTVIETA